MKKILTILCLAFIAIQGYATEEENYMGVYSYQSDSTSISFKFTIEGIEELHVDSLVVDPSSIKYDMLGVYGEAFAFQLMFADSEGYHNIIKFFNVLDNDDAFLLAPGYYLRYSFDESANRSTVIKKESVSFDFEPERY